MDNRPNRQLSYVTRVQNDTHRIVRELLQDSEKLREQLQRLTAELQRSMEKNASEFAQLERKSADLANLYVASYQLHGTLDRRAVLTAIREIVINLIGSEEMGVFELAEGGSVLELSTSFGIVENDYARVSLTADPLGRLVAAGEPYLAGRSPAVPGLPPLLACVPMKVDGRVTGAVVVFSLLAHKPELQDIDFELLDLLGTQGATALYCTALQSRLAPV